MSQLGGGERAKDMDRHLTEEDTYMVNKHMKRHSTSYVIREFQIKTAMRHHYVSIRIAKILKSDTAECWT